MKYDHKRGLYLPEGKILKGRPTELMQVGPNFYSGGAAAASGGFDPLYVPANYTLSNGNTTVSSTSAFANSSVLSLNTHNSGKYYFEFAFNNYLFNSIGINNDVKSTAVNSQVGDTVHSWGWFNQNNTYHSGSTTAYGPGGTNGMVLGCAIDWAAGKIWWSKNNVWVNSGDPAAGTNPAYTGQTFGTAYIAVNLYNGSPTSGTCKFTSASLTYAPPSGFSAWE